MRLKSVLLGSAFATVAVGMAAAADVDSAVYKATPVPPAPAPFFLFQDTFLSYRHEFTGTDPGVGTTPKDIWGITHVDAWQYGTNFVNLDWLQSSPRDPAFCSPANGAICNNSEGALEFYGVYRGTFSWNALTHSKMFTSGPVKDIGFSFGGDWETENNGFVPEKKDVVGGIQVQVAVPQGFLNINIHAYQEWNHVGLPGIITPNVTFNTVPEFEVALEQPLTFTGLPLRFTNFTAVILPKGPDGFGTPTKTETYVDSRLWLDVGKVAFDKPGLYDVFVGYKYWNNKFGSDANTVIGGREETWLVGLAWHALSNQSLFAPPPAPVANPGYTKAVPVAPAPSFFLFEDTFVSYRHEFTATDPGVGTTPKDVGSITHVDAWAYGTNFLNLEWLQSTSRDPANCQATAAVCASSEGAMEFYGAYRGTWSWNALSHSKMFTFGPIKDIGFSFGGDWETENNGFVPEKKDVVGGLQVQLAVPQGFFNVAVHAYQEWNHVGLPGIINTNVTFKTVPEVEISYLQPLTFTGLPLRISGFTEIVPPKGTDGFGNQTKTEVFCDNRLVLDVGKLVINKPGLYDTFVGYRYWNNKFGSDANTVPGGREETFYLGASWHVL